MATSIHVFNVGLYEEHLEEASFLYEQRWAYITDAEVDWPALHQWDERFEAHLDALVVGGDTALDVCRAKAAEDAGKLHTALRLCCRQNRKGDVFDMVAQVDPADAVAARAASRALCTDLPTGWRDDVVVELQRQPDRRAVYAHVIGYRRVAAEAVLVRILADGGQQGRADVAWALGRVGTQDAVRPLRALLSAPTADNRLKEAAAIGLLRLGDEWPLAQAFDVSDTQPWARRVLAIGGAPRAASALRAGLQASQVDPDAVLAIGLLGDLGTVGPLLELLDREDVAPSAAVALNTITGAGLHERVFVPYEFDVDELNDEERAAYDTTGTLPMKGKEKYGSVERVPLLDKAGWRSWLEQNRHRFEGGLRWRMGQPYGPRALVRCLEVPSTPHAIRSAAYDELVTRYRMEVPFEVDLPIPRQLHCLARLDQWATQHSERFVPGRWYLAGELQG